MKIKLSIKNRFTGSVLFEYEKEDNTIKETVEQAVKSGANLGGANLHGANLGGANLHGAKIKTAIVFTGLYDYIVIPYITEENIKRVKMGCYNRSLEEWEADFWNNDCEFPNNGSVKSRCRLMAFETAKAWFKIIEQQ